MNTEKKSSHEIPTVSTILPDGRIVELVYLPEEKKTCLAEYKDGVTLLADSLPLDSGAKLVPISAGNNLIKHRAVLLPGVPEDFGSSEKLRKEIEDHLYRYVDLSDSFRALASTYMLRHIRLDASLVAQGVSARVNQILVPLLSITKDKTLQNCIREAATSLEMELRANQAATSEGELLEALLELFTGTTQETFSVGEITAHFVSRSGKDHTRPITSRYVGYLLRKRLHLIPHKRHGVYVLSVAERPKIEALCARYGIEVYGT